MADKIRVAPMDTSMKNSPVSGPVSEEATVVMNSATEGCFWNGESFPEGSVVDDNGTAYECSFGQWAKRE